MYSEYKQWDLYHVTGCSHGIGQKLRKMSFQGYMIAYIVICTMLQANSQIESTFTPSYIFSEVNFNFHKNLNILSHEFLEISFSFSRFTQYLGHLKIILYWIDFSLQGVIVTTGLLDAFVTPQYQLTIEARDVTPSTNVASINQVMTIVIRGTNRYRPTFDQSMYSATIPRDTPIGRVVLIMHATDLDSGLNGAVTYSIDRRTGNGSSLFDIDPITGALSVLGPLQVGDQYLTVVATDRGNVALWSSVTVKVVVTDVAYGQLLVVTPPQNSTIYVQQVSIFTFNKYNPLFNCSPCYNVFSSRLIFFKLWNFFFKVLRVKLVRGGLNIYNLKRR